MLLLPTYEFEREWRAKLVDLTRFTFLKVVLNGTLSTVG
jgi:hypothetical protein